MKPSRRSIFGKTSRQSASIDIGSIQLPPVYPFTASIFPRNAWRSKPVHARAKSMMSSLSYVGIAAPAASRVYVPFGWSSYSPIVKICITSRA